MFCECPTSVNCSLCNTIECGYCYNCMDEETKEYMEYHAGEFKNNNVSNSVGNNVIIILEVILVLFVISLFFININSSTF